MKFSRRYRWKIWTFLIISFCAYSDLYAQDSKLRARLSGRLLIDGLVSLQSPDTLQSQLNIVDLRIGAKVNYKDWYLKLDVGYAGNKIRIKDAFGQYRFGYNFFRVGYMFGFFGIDQYF